MTEFGENNFKGSQRESFTLTPEEAELRAERRKSTVKELDKLADQGIVPGLPDNFGDFYDLPETSLPATEHGEQVGLTRQAEQQAWSSAPNNPGLAIGLINAVQRLRRNKNRTDRI